MAGWGPIEPATSGGNYGGIDDCRTTWAPDEVPTTGPLSKLYSGYGIPENAAVIAISTLRLGGFRTSIDIELNALDGIADDSFTVYVLYKTFRGWKKHELYTYEWSGDTAEFWVTHPIHLKHNY